MFLFLRIWYKSVAENYGTIHESLTQIVLGKITFPELVLWFQDLFISVPIIMFFQINFQMFSFNFL